MNDNDFAKQIESVEANIAALQLTLAVEKGVLARLKAIRAGAVVPSPNAELVRQNKLIDDQFFIRPNTLPDKARTVLLQSGKSMHISEIASGIQTLGFTTEGKTDIKTLLASALARCKAFKRVGPGTFDLTQRSEAKL